MPDHITPLLKTLQSHLYRSESQSPQITCKTIHVTFHFSSDVISYYSPLILSTHVAVISSHTLSMLPSQGLCTCCSFVWNTLFPDKLFRQRATQLASSSLIFLKCHLSEDFSHALFKIAVPLQSPDPFTPLHLLPSDILFLTSLSCLSLQLKYKLTERRYLCLFLFHSLLCLGI